jgi:hypothetical protein
LFCVVLCIVCFVSFCVLLVCKCVLYNCHRVATHLQLIYHIINVLMKHHVSEARSNSVFRKEPNLMDPGYP